MPFQLKTREPGSTKQESPLILNLLRAAFILLAGSVATLYVLPYQEEQRVEYMYVVLMLGVSSGIAIAIVAMDMFIRQKRLAALSGVFLGMVAGLVVAYAASLVVDLVGMLTSSAFDPEQRDGYRKLLEGVKVFIGLITSYLGISLVIQTKDDFRFVIPYVEFAKEVRGMRPILLDTSIIIDGRIVDIVDTRILQGSLIVPRFVLSELQLIADSADKVRRARGRRGLEILQQLQGNAHLEVVMDDADADGGTTDLKLVALAEQMRGRIMTNDYNLGKIAQLRGVSVINLNDLAKALRPVALPGESMSVKIIKAGEGPSQGVGYLDDGTMVVVENARDQIGNQINLAVTSTLQTSAGRMIFGRFGVADNADAAGESRHSVDGFDSPGGPPPRSASRSPRRR